MYFQSQKRSKWMSCQPQGNYVSFNADSCVSFCVSQSCFLTQRWLVNLRLFKQLEDHSTSLMKFINSSIVHIFLTIILKCIYVVEWNLNKLFFLNNLIQLMKLLSMWYIKDFFWFVSTYFSANLYYITKRRSCSPGGKKSKKTVGLMWWDKIDGHVLCPTHQIVIFAMDHQKKWWIVSDGLLYVISCLSFTPMLLIWAAAGHISDEYNDLWRTSKTSDVNCSPWYWYPVVLSRLVFHHHLWFITHIQT